MDVHLSTCAPSPGVASVKRYPGVTTVFWVLDAGENA